MFTRAEHWISIGIITALCGISESTIRRTTGDLIDDTSQVSADQNLVAWLKTGLKPDTGHVDHILKYHTRDPSNVVDVSVNPIVEACGEDYTYTPEIAVSFHRLLLSSLLSYVFRLRIVNTAVRTLAEVLPDPDPSKKKLPKAVEIAFLQLLFSAQLLFLVSHSRLLKMHLKILKGKVEIPVERNVASYMQEFARLAEWHTQTNVRDQKLVKNLEALSKRPPQSPPAFPASTAPEELYPGAPDEVLLDCVVSENGPEVVYRRWIMGLVDHFASIRVLERVSRRLPCEAKINFSLLGLNRPSLQSGSWATMTAEIRRLCEVDSLVSEALVSRESKEPPPDFANKAIEIIQTNIEHFAYQNIESVNKTSKRFETTVYAFFRKLVDTNMSPNFRGCGHCEAILMAIIDRISKKDDLEFSLKACLP
jgi:hypothetical protein